MKTNIQALVALSAAAIKLANQSLTPREREVAERRCLPQLVGGCPEPRGRLSEEMGVSKSRVRNVEGRYFAKLARAAAAAAAVRAEALASSRVVEAEGYEVSAAE